MRRTLLATAVLAVVAALAGPALATTAPPIPVGVGRDSKGGVCVYAFSWVPQCVDPVVASAAPKVTDPLPVWVYQRSDGSICAGYSTTRPICTPPLNTVAALPAQKLPTVTVVNNSYAVGVLIRDGNGGPIGAAVVAKDGSNACIGLSYQVPFCLN